MSSGFISETEIAEKRRLRQEEWEKVRQPDQPLEAPEEEYDPRSLFERLEEQKRKKEFEYEESHRLKNMIKGLDDDEIEFLDLVDRSKLEEEHRKKLEEDREMADFRNKVASYQEKSLEQRINQEIRQTVKLTNNVSTGRTSQTKLLAGAVVKKRPLESRPEEKPGAKKRPLLDESPKAPSPQPKSEGPQTNKRTRDVRENENGESEVKGKAPTPIVVVPEEPIKSGSLTCVGILPGLGDYEHSSEESDASTDIEETPGKYDLAGRSIQKKARSEEN